MTYRPERGWGFSSPSTPPAADASELKDLRRRITRLESIANLQSIATFTHCKAFC
jgi:hypothetical protein